MRNTNRNLSADLSLKDDRLTIDIPLTARFQVDIDEIIMKKSFLSFLNLLLTLTPLLAQSTGQNDLYKELTPGVWKIVIGKPEKLNLLSELTLNPRLETIRKMPQTRFPISKDDLSLEVIDGKTYVRFPLAKDENIYGPGLNFKTVEQRGRIMRLHVDHYVGQDNGRAYAPVSFFVSSKGYGALINSARYIDCWVGTSVRENSQSPPIVKDRISALGYRT